MANDRIPVILDTDIGEDIDDLYALYLALLHPKLELRAVTTAHGNAQGRARLAAKAIRLAGKAGIPIGSGIGLAQARMARGVTREFVNVRATHLNYVTKDDPEFGQNYPPASEILKHTLSVAAEPVAIACIGAASNVAQLLTEADEALRKKIRCIALMSGEPQTMMAEYNVVCDPEAADVIYNSGLPVFMGTFEVTRQLVLTMEEVDREFGKSAHPVHKALAECTKMWGLFRGDKPGPVLYDLVPLFWLADPNAVKTRPCAIRVELQGQYTRGMTVRVSRKETDPVLESLSLNAPELVKQLVALLKGA